MNRAENGKKVQKPYQYSLRNPQKKNRMQTLSERNMMFVKKKRPVPLPMEQAVVMV
jgi:hypothetical protein